MKLRFFGLVALLSSFICGGLAVSADASTEVGSSAVVNVAAPSKGDSGNAVSADASTEVGSSAVVNVAAPSKDDSGNFETESWRKDVKFVLYDSGLGNENCEKTIEIQGLPEDVDVDWLRVWTDGCSMSGTSNFIEKGKCLVYDENSKVWKATLKPWLDAKCTSCRNLCEGSVMNLFNGILFLSRRGSHIDPLSFEISNKGLKKPEYLSDFRNFKLERFHEDGEGFFLKICGIPSNVSAIDVLVEESPGEGKKGPWDRVVTEKSVMRSEKVGWDFVVSYNPRNGGGEKLVEITFSDSDGYSYLITEVIN